MCDSTQKKIQDWQPSRAKESNHFETSDPLSYKFKLEMNRAGHVYPRTLSSMHPVVLKHNYLLFAFQN